MTRDDLTRTIRFEPGGGRMRVRFLLSGEKGATQFLWNVFTEGESRSPWSLGIAVDAPEGRDLGFHAASPRDWQSDDDRIECDVLPQGYCYYDGSPLQGERLGERFHELGEEVVWATLEDRYEVWLEGRDDA